MSIVKAQKASNLTVIKLFLSVFYLLVRRLDWSVYTCLTQLYGGRDMYNLLHKEQLHVSALFTGHLGLMILVRRMEKNLLLENSEI